MNDLELREAFHRVGAAEFKVLARERMIREWRDTNRFCGEFGAGMEYVEKREYQVLWLAGLAFPLDFLPIVR